MAWLPERSKANYVKAAAGTIFVLLIVLLIVNAVDWSPYLVKLEVFRVTRQGLQPLNTTSVTLTGYDIFLLRNNKNFSAFHYTLNSTSDMQIQYWVQVAGNSTLLTMRQTNDTSVPSGYYGLIWIVSPQPYVVVFKASKA